MKEYTKEELDKRSRKYFFISLPLIFTMIFFILFLYFIPDFDFYPVVFALFIISIVLTIIGVIILYVYSGIPKYLSNNYEILKQITDDIKIIEKYVLAKYEDIYIVGKYGTLYFFAFYDEPMMTTNKVHFKQTFWVWNKKEPIPNLNVYREEGEFTIPTTEGNISGKGVLLAVDCMANFTYIPDLSRENILRVVEYLKKIRNENLNKMDASA